VIGEKQLRSLARKTLPAPVFRRLGRQRSRIWRLKGLGETQILVRGWELYAQRWSPESVSPRMSPGRRVQYLGDEWTARAEHEYGVPPDVASNYENYIDENLLTPYLPPMSAEGLEIGPGGGRFTPLLLSRTKTLHVAEPSKSMLRILKQRFTGVPNLRLHHTDGMTLPSLGPATMDYVCAFDVFVNFEPRLSYWYLRQIEGLLKPGGISILNYSNILTPLGWHAFESQLEENLQRRIDPGALGVMCPQLMVRFLEALQLEVISADVGVIPRDAVAVFRKPMKVLGG
jgi:SAM-dependent methyltransferase